MINTSEISNDKENKETNNNTLIKVREGTLSEFDEEEYTSDKDIDINDDDIQTQYMVLEENDFENDDENNNICNIGNICKIDSISITSTGETDKKYETLLETGNSHNNCITNNSEITYNDCIEYYQYILQKENERYLNTENHKIKNELNTNISEIRFNNCLNETNSNYSLCFKSNDGTKKENKQIIKEKPNKLNTTNRVEIDKKKFNFSGFNLNSNKIKNDNK